MPRINAAMIQTATDVARLALSRPSGDVSERHRDVVAAVLAACSALERHQDHIVGLKPLLELARRACGESLPAEGDPRATGEGASTEAAR